MDKLKVRFSGFWTNDATLYSYIKLFANGADIWKNLSITLSNDFDFLIILTRPYDYRILEGLPTHKVVLFLTEPIVSPNVDQKLIEKYIFFSWKYFFLPTWSQVTLLQRKQIWSQTAIQKDQLISTVCSEILIISEDFKGYFHRLRFLDYIDKNSNNFIHHYGRLSSGRIFKKFSCYKGEIENKYDALIPYKYHLNCENSYQQGYFTEKLVDALFAECLCFYCGHKNIDKIIDDRAYIRLNLEEPEQSFQTIIQAIENNEYEQRLTYIRKEKKRLLNELNPLNLVLQLVKS